jgi:hypothetical protein
VSGSDSTWGSASNSPLPPSPSSVSEGNLNSASVVLVELKT